MATEATFTIPAHEFPLGTLFERLPGATIELERIIPAQSVVIPYVWVRGTDVEDLEAMFLDHPGVVDIRLVDSVAGAHLLSVEWTADYPGVLSTLLESRVSLISGVGTDEQWTFEVRGEDRRDIAAFQDRCREAGISIALAKLQALTPIDAAAAPALTDAQRDALVLAYDRGYFNTPRDVTMAELGDDLGISQQAVASRLRRGIKAILAGTLAEHPPPD